MSAFWFHDYLVGAVAYILFMGLRTSFRLARLTEELRKEVAIPAVHDPNELPFETRNRVIEGVKGALRRPASAKTIAAHTLGISERLNAHPPGITGTAVLLAVYVATFAMAGLALGGMFVGKGRRQMAGPPTPDTPPMAGSAPGAPTRSAIVPRS